MISTSRDVFFIYKSNWVSIVVIDLSRHFKDPCLTPSSLGSFVNQINHIYPTSKLVLHVCFWVYLSLIFAQLSNEKEIVAKNIESYRKFAFFYSRNVTFSFFLSFDLLSYLSVQWRGEDCWKQKQTFLWPKIVEKKTYKQKPRTRKKKTGKRTWRRIRAGRNKEEKNKNRQLWNILIALFFVYAFVVCLFFSLWGKGNFPSRKIFTGDKIRFGAF